jgi:hypothetical protein
MKLPRNSVLVAALAAVPVVTGVTLAIVLSLVRGKYETEQSATRTFTIDVDFTSVRKIFVRRDAAKQLVTMGGGSKFLDNKWEAIVGDLGPLKLIDAEWRLELHGKLRVLTQDDYVGEQEIELAQDVEIERDFLHSEVDLAKPAERLRDYRMTTHLERDASGKTSVQLKLSQRILTDAPWFAHGIADRRVRASVERTLANQEAAIRQLVAENIDDVPRFPWR